MKCSCKSEKGYTYSLNQSSFNSNDILGILLFIYIILLILGMVYLCYLYKKGYSLKKGCIVLGTLILLFMIIVCYRPILLLYIPSSFLSFFLKTPEFLDRTTVFPNHVLFEEEHSFKKLKSEIDEVMKKTNNGDSILLTKNSFNGENSYIGSEIKIENGITKGWRILNIKAGTEYSPIAKTHFPHLVSLLKKTPEIKSCVISVLQPGIGIPIHVGYYKGMLRYMVATHVPKERDKVFLCVNGKKYKWKEGEGVLWDDTFPHKVYNQTDENRIIIYMDVVRPFRNSYLHSINNWFIHQAMTSKIVKDEIKRTEVQTKLE